ncbi:hypothetical protein SAMN04490202_0176 [Pseudomonas reinekei]|uniref:Rhodanese domain-containing protein n=1 Tax=Pseudomonas reinekei TaxID=395598 RepID=A0A1H0HNR8_PSERE|nr:hypothetical protein SAMN04490202_0176 [Pseudomonas reinekei]
MTSLVREIPAAPSAIALMHFSNRLTFETDCSDVHGSQAAGVVDFILVDVRGPLAFERGHVPGRSIFRGDCSTLNAWRLTPNPVCSWSIAPDRIATARTRRQ